MSKKNDSFSFDSDPGKMTDKDDAEFTFADIPVLGDDKKKDAFSLDQITDKDQIDPSIASFEALLGEQPKEEPDSETEDLTETGNIIPPPELKDASATNIDVQRVINARDAKKKKKLFLMLGAVGGVLLLIVVISMVVISKLYPPEKKENEMTAEEKAALAEKKKQEKIIGMIASAKSLLDAGETERALASYKNVLRIDRQRSVAHTGCGKCFEKLSNPADAKVSYQKAIDNSSKIPDPYFSLALILSGEEETDKAISLLELGKTKFADNPNILYLLGDAYYKTGNTEKALDNYSKVPQKELTKESLNNFGALLETESLKQAKELFEFGGKKFKDHSLFLKASNAAEENKEKVRILTEAVDELKESDTENIDEIKYLLAKALSDNNENAKVIEILKGINIAELDKQYCNQLIHIATKAGLGDLKEYTLKILTSKPNDISLQKTIQADLLATQEPDKILKIYSEWLQSHEEDPIANYLYGMALRDSPSARRYFENALLIKPAFFEAVMELAKINIREKKYNSAELNLKKATKLRSEEKEPNYLLSVVKIRKGKGTEAIRDYSIYLSKNKVPVSKKSMELFELSLLLPTSTSADNYLNQIKADASLKEEYKNKSAKKKLVFGGAKDADFRGSKNKELKEYYILYLLSKGKYTEANSVPLTLEEHPAFWKIYILRKSKSTTWKSLAELFLEKKKNTAKPVELLIISMWLEKFNLEEAEQKMYKLTPETEGLFYVMLAEEYIKQKNSTKANIRLRRGKAAAKSIYSGFIEHIYNSRMR